MLLMFILFIVQFTNVLHYLKYKYAIEVYVQEYSFIEIFYIMQQL